jgi:hypothetical protein
VISLLPTLAVVAVALAALLACLSLARAIEPPDDEGRARRAAPGDDGDRRALAIVPASAVDHRPRGARLWEHRRPLSRI